MKKRNLGFTLLELMIAVAIVAILAAFAFPAYQEQVDKTRRADGKALLTNMAQQLERCYTKYLQYNNAGCPITNGTTQQSEDQFYSVTVAGATATTFSLTAIPQGVQAGDTRCGNLTLDQTGAQTFSGTGTVADCW